MKQQVECRVCGSAEISRLPIGIYEPFFQLRIDISKDPFAIYSLQSSISMPERRQSVRAKIRRFARRRGWKMPWQSKRRFFRTMCQLCSNCQSLTPCHEFSYEDLSGFYRDYRSARYNSDRISVEPGYARIAEQVGNSKIEEHVRNAAVTEFLLPHKRHVFGGAVIDIGGSDGRFVPACIVEGASTIDILDASAAAVHPGANRTKIRKVNCGEKDAYSLLLCMHVLEHVGNPRAFFADALTLLRPGGHAYIEVPLESTAELRNQFQLQTIDMPFHIHEHINAYDESSVPQLTASVAGLDMIDSRIETIDIGWNSGRVGRYLVKKSANAPRI